MAASDNTTRAHLFLLVSWASPVSAAPASCSLGIHMSADPLGDPVTERVGCPWSVSGGWQS